MPVVFKKGDLFSQKTQALVNTVNCVGVMGKGVALEFKHRWPENYSAYRIACRHKSLRPGMVHVFHLGDLFANDDIQFIINFPTKDHWRSRSKLSYIEDGLDALVDALQEKRISSVAMPPLGCGNGGLNWTDVKPVIQQKLEHLNGVEIVVLEPEGVELHPEHDVSSLPMTYARAVLIKTLGEFEKLFDEEYDRLSLQKIVYFLQVLGVPFDLKFDHDVFGPYSLELKKAFFALERQGFLNGFSSGERLAGVSSGAYASAIEFLEQAGQEQQAQVIVDRLDHLIEGYEGPFGLELLASVHRAAEVEKLVSASEVVDAMTRRTASLRNEYSSSVITAAFDRLVEDRVLKVSNSAEFA